MAAWRSLPRIRFGRGARRYFAEFLVITAGVLVALVLEQAVANWRERQRVGDIRASMDGEIADFAEIFTLRQRVSDCVTAKLDAIETRVRAEGGGAGPPIVDVGRTPYFFSSQGAWSSDAADLLARHIGAATYKDYGEIYQGMREFGTLARDEQEAWTTLLTLEGETGPFSEERRVRLREAVARARNAHLLMDAISEQMLVLASAVGVERNRVLEGVRWRTSAICRPLAPLGPAAE